MVEGLETFVLVTRWYGALMLFAVLVSLWWFAFTKLSEATRRRDLCPLARAMAASGLSLFVLYEWVITFMRIIERAPFSIRSPLLAVASTIAFLGIAGVNYCEHRARQSISQEILDVVERLTDADVAHRLRDELREMGYRVGR